MATTASPELVPCPYPGLRPFRRSEAGYFFGRDEQVTQLMRRLRQPAGSRLLTVLGPSGCGKTSLIEAGLIPTLKQSSRSGDAGQRWEVVKVQPGARLYRDLSAELVRCYRSLEKDWDSGEAAAVVRDMLRRSPLGLIRVLEGVAEADRASLLLVVDPFEEFLLDRAWRESEETQATVALLIASATQNCRVPVHVVLVLRADFIGECSWSPELARVVTEGAFVVPGIAREHLPSVIEEPARELGGAVDPQLVSRLVSDMTRRRDQLPTLQHLLMRMWRRACEPTARAVPDSVAPTVTLTLQHYQDVGGFDDALSRTLDEGLRELDDTGRRIAETMFRLLSARRSLLVDTKRPVLMADVIREVKGVSLDQVRQVITKFHDPSRGLITPQNGLQIEEDTPFLIGHETLISGWKWLDRVVARGWRDHDVFLCHNSINKPAAREIALRLRRDFNIFAWLDEWELQPGMPWQRAISERMKSIRSIAVIIGRDGPGPWQEQEVERGLREAVKRSCPVIPVILKDCERDPELPDFLENLEALTWVDFRKDAPDPWRRLVWGITGERAETDESGPSSDAPPTAPSGEVKAS
jgi:hypothetical protein